MSGDWEYKSRWCENSLLEGMGEHDLSVSSVSVETGLIIEYWMSTLERDKARLSHLDIQSHKHMLPSCGWAWSRPYHRASHYAKFVTRTCSCCSEGNKGIEYSFSTITVLWHRENHGLHNLRSSNCPTIIFGCPNSRHSSHIYCN